MARTIVRGDAAATGYTGSVKVKVEPSPGAEWTSSEPPRAWAIERAMNSLEAGAGLAAADRRAPELLEDQRLVLGGDARPLVPHGDAHAAVLTREADVHLPPRPPST